MSDLVDRDRELLVKLATLNKTRPHTRFGEIVDTSSSYFEQHRQSMYTKHVLYGSVPGWCSQFRCRYSHHIFMCHKYHVKHTSKQCNLDSWKSISTKGHQRDDNLLRCLYTPQRRTLFGEGKSGVQLRLFCILCQGVWGLGVCVC